MASLADTLAHKALDIFANKVRFGFFITAFKIRDYALINGVVFVAITELHAILFFARTIENFLDVFFGNLTNWFAHREAVACANGREAL